ncbi:MAG: LytR C-terminal domain-containing protein [candidate division Zixibacteria bacterium]|nr:LytR C-terminal domain-containing protein [candidate division Zixibacteria bacterium]
MLRRRNRHLPGIDDKSGGSGRKSFRLWLLEGMIVLLVGVNVFFLYTLMTGGNTPVEPLSAPPEQPSPSFVHVQVEILNGCGDPAVSQAMLKYLRKQGFDVVNMENAEHFNFPETIVLDRSGQETVSEAAAAVAQALGTPNVVRQRNDDRMVDVTAIIGQDYDRLLFYDD